MDNSRKGVISKIIDKRIAELEQILATSSTEDDTRREQLSDEATRCDALANQCVDSLLLTRARDDLIRLYRQRERIDHDEFGLCQICAAEISANRIASVPATVLCIRCAQQQEKQQ